MASTTRPAVPTTVSTASPSRPPATAPVDRARSPAGTAIVPSGAKKVTVALAGISASDFVLATVQGNTAFSVKGALAGTGQVTIWLNKATSGDVTVAYFVLSAP